MLQCHISKISVFVINNIPNTQNYHNYICDCFFKTSNCKINLEDSPILGHIADIS